MAKFIQLTSGSLFCGNPIMVSIGAEYVSDKATFHRVKLEVSAALMGVSSEYHNYILSSPALSGETIQLDISSALRSVAEQFTYEYLTTDKTYPYLVYKLTAYDEYMIDGILRERVGERNYGSTLSALMGAFTDMERYISGVTKSVQRFSRKPSRGEVCAASDTLLYPTPFNVPADISTALNNGPTVKAHPLTGLSGVATFDGHTVYVLPTSSSADRFSFQFVNSLGVVESISATALAENNTEMEVESFIVTSPGSFNKFRRNIIRKLSDRKSISMCSGPVDARWEDWWMHEFLNTGQAWIYLDGYWVSCGIVPEDTVRGINRFSGDFYTVEFTVELDLLGGVLNRI